ncbi:MAG TPA: DUF1614 domain-containing protein, partial [Firmicutes bacterium]|nr:DUF1614 domain-containing protein [Bacillota bacterium]
RSAFIAGSMGLLLTDIFSRVEVALRGGSGRMVIGGAGVFDGIVIGGLLALFLAELFGETRERLQGGPSTRRPRDLVEGLADAEFGADLEDEEPQKQGEKEEKQHD